MSNINGLNPKNDLTDGILTDCTTNGTFIIKCDDNTLYDLQTPNNGNNTDVLTSDGVGNTYWAAGGAVNPFNQALNTYDPVIFQTISSFADTGALQFSELYPKVLNDLNIGTQNTQVLNLGSDSVNLANGELSLLNKITTNTIYPKTFTTSFIDLSVDENIKVNTSNFLLNGTQIATIDDIPGPQTLQSVIDNSGIPVICQVNYGNTIVFKTDDSDNILTLNSISTNAYGITADFANLDSVRSVITYSNSFIKNGGTSNQYLMADGSSLQYSQNSGNSNFYLYDNSNGITTPPPSNGHIGYNNAIQANATIIYISHLTSDNIGIDVFFTQLTSIQDVYIQDKNSSVNFIKYNITGTPTIITNSYISIPVLYTAPNGAGTGLTSFGNNTPLIISFFTNSIEVDTRLTSLETKTQYINILGSNSMAITANSLYVNSLSSYADLTPLPIGATSSSVDILAPIINVKTILATTNNTYDLGSTGNSFRIGYFTTAVRSPLYDTSTSTPLNIAPTNATSVNIGRSGITSTILGTTNINSVYTLPNTAPAVGQVITCGSLGVANWITPSVGAFSFVYPYPTATRTVIIGAGTRTLCNTYTMTSNITFSSASLFFPVTGSDTTRVGIYRGDLTTATLVGQTASTAPSSAYFTRTITVVVGQSLTFTVGQQIVIAFTQNGSTTSISTTTGVSNLALAFISTTGYSAAGFPALISGIALPAATIVRQNIDLY